MEIGPLIKLHRIKQNMKQGELAKGIVSESYLSKIENQKTKANTQVINMLCNRLGIRLDIEENQADIVNKCRKWFKLLYDFNDKEIIMDDYKDLNDLVNKSLTEINTLFEIHKVQYYLLTDQRQKALSQIKKLKGLKHTFNDEDLYYWYKFVGNYHLSAEVFKQAIRYYLLAMEEYTKVGLDDEEEADLNYLIAYNYCKMHNPLEAIDYVTKPLSYYRENYNIVRCAQGHLVLGVSYRRIRAFDKAIENFDIAAELASIINREDIKRLIYIQLGFLYAAKRESDKVISYFNQVLEDEHATVEERLIAICSLSEEYYFANKIEKKKELLEYGFSILEKVDKAKERYLFFRLKLTSHYHFITGNIEEFESIVINEFIPYLEKQNDYVSLVIYGKMIGEHFEKVNKYKSACQYYKLSSKSYEKLVQLS
ncbi:helix-turn-helix domain-containing protein [Aquibacillus albus]|uniref:Tetratricopeptide (TPR) repeat protein n=1 Tax=Aquibacillus albus TaxID=1168171 RepID=A0ABS2N4K5_9BACI|nr:helix-turn-helix transcriptional regulator [Aquibacillus albus]MBM7572805.1 tetratricopeptide (TPR) repeat protein [Aquibacillus albus]